jgi:hypothetical protein
MKTNVNVYDFRDTIMALRPNNFSYEGLGVLFDWLEEYEECCEDEIIFEPIAICCEFSEAHWADIADDYSIDLADCDDDESKAAEVRDYLDENTLVCGETSGTIVYQDF